MTTVHQRAREAAMPVECKKDVLKQNQDGTWKLTLTIAPDGLPDEIMRAMPGTRYQAVFVEVGDNEEPVAKARLERSDKPRRHFHTLPLSQQAALRCQDAGFREFLKGPTEAIGMISIETAVIYVRDFCGVESRAELDDKEAPRGKWQTLNAEYEQWAGLVAEDRS